MDIYRALLARISTNRKNTKSISDYSQSQYNIFRILEVNQGCHHPKTSFFRSNRKTTATASSRRNPCSCGWYD